eukprot:1693699-Pyramimonas_sp.AAC.1
MAPAPSGTSPTFPACFERLVIRNGALPGPRADGWGDRATGTGSDSSPMSAGTTKVVTEDG